MNPPPPIFLVPGAPSPPASLGPPPQLGPFGSPAFGRHRGGRFPRRPPPLPLRGMRPCAARAFALALPRPPPGSGLRRGLRLVTPRSTGLIASSGTGWLSLLRARHSLPRPSPFRSAWFPPSVGLTPRGQPSGQGARPLDPQSSPGKRAFSLQAGRLYAPASARGSLPGMLAAPGSLPRPYGLSSASPVNCAPTAPLRGAVRNFPAGPVKGHSAALDRASPAQKAQAAWRGKELWED